MQEQAFHLLQTNGSLCFLRVSKTGDSLWVTDLPRRMECLSQMDEQLDRLGLCCRLDPTTRLWHIDLTSSQYAALATELPTAVPAFPADESLHEAYALCRLLLAHPATLEDQPRSSIRAILKWMAYPDKFPFPASLHQQCAALLRQGKSLPHLGGQLLAAWLIQKGEFA